ncbi:MAG: hypothetical protein CM1200mP36_02380 [Gammaproteobacteria bacterium]|nr:MAG: hypothetical protein CM1200mP36_02380 [Gammaproteobacteria bacterium]
MENLLGALGTQLDPAIIGSLVLSWSGRVLAALVIFLIGRWVARALTGWFGRAVAGAEMDETLSRFLSSLIYIVLMVFVVLTALSALGVNTMNFLAILGAAGLAVGLALKDSLANFAGGRDARALQTLQVRGLHRGCRDLRLCAEYWDLQHCIEDSRQSRDYRTQLINSRRYDHELLY